MKFTVYNLDLNYADFLLVIGNKHTDKYTDTQTDKYTDKQTDKYTDKQTDKYTDKHTDKLTDKHTDTQIDKYTDKHTDNPNIEIYIKRGQKTEFKEFEPRLKHDWFHLKLCSVVSRFEPALDRNRFLCSSATRFKFFKFGLRSHKVKSMA